MLSSVARLWGCACRGLPFATETSSLPALVFRAHSKYPSNIPRVLITRAKPSWFSFVLPNIQCFDFRTNSHQ